MATLTYWYAPCKYDSDCYSIRERLKKYALTRLAEHGASPGEDGCWYSDSGERLYGPLVKVTVHYLDAFDLMDSCLSEGSLYQESDAVIAAERK